MEVDATDRPPRLFFFFFFFFPLSPRCWSQVGTLGSLFFPLSLPTENKKQNKKAKTVCVVQRRVSSRRAHRKARIKSNYFLFAAHS